ncbi:hypothetical protein GWD52_16175 [Enterobacteriaceae bacterium 4M9]|nr:hypothetical protein [Enterobacteriaceae bacterium 4M9]
MYNTEHYIKNLRTLFDAQPRPSMLPGWLWLPPEQRERRLRELLQPLANTSR